MPNYFFISAYLKKNLTQYLLIEFWKRQPYAFQETWILYSVSYELTCIVLPTFMSNVATYFISEVKGCGDALKAPTEIFVFLLKPLPFVAHPPRRASLFIMKKVISWYAYAQPVQWKGGIVILNCITYN